MVMVTAIFIEITCAPYKLFACEHWKCFIFKDFIWVAQYVMCGNYRTHL